MPTSHPFQLNEIAHLVTLLKPQRVLEIGVGFGKYGMILREYLEIWGEGQDYKTWTKRIDGIEIFEPYILPHHREIYDEIYIGNALEVLPDLSEYDLILLIDVLEHFKADDAHQLLELCKSKATSIIISTPKDIGEQGEGYGNIYETHHSQWSQAKLKASVSPELLFLPNTYSHLALYTTTDQLRMIKKAMASFRISSPIKKHLFGLYSWLKRIRS